MSLIPYVHCNRCMCGVFIVVSLLVALLDIRVFSGPELKAYFEQECLFFLSVSKVDQHYRSHLVHLFTAVSWEAT